MLDIREKIVSGELPEAALTAIATMTFPLPLEDFVALFPLVYDRGDEAIRAAVIQSVNSIPGDQLLDVIRQTPDPSLLPFYFEQAVGGQLENSNDMLLSVVSNPACDRELLVAAGRSSNTVLLDWLLNNQRLLQQHPDLVEALEQNEALSAAQRRKLEEYFKFGILGDRKGIEETISAGVGGAEPEAEAEPEEPEEPGEALVLLSEFQKMESEEVLSATSAIEVDEDMDLNTYQKLLKMTVSDKIQRALKGNKEERTILIRDSNRTVALAVMESPKLTDQEVEAISAMRNVHRDVIRKIGSSRKFLKKYKVVLNLVKNPKTPQDISMGLLHRLTDRDLQLLVRDRTVTEFLRRTAQRILRGRKKH